MTEAERRRKSFGIGYLLSLAGSPLPITQRAPIAYLYNGVQLPALPEWDKETYPYASIIYDGTQFWVHAQTQAEKIVRYDDRFGYVYMVESYTTGKQWYLDNSGTWKLYDVIYRIKANVELYSYKKTPEDYAVWTNYDVIWADTGEIFFAASDPVPVYE